jgi:hypothetical protein
LKNILNPDQTERSLLNTCLSKRTDNNCNT